MRVEKLTSHIGAELFDVSLAEAARNDDLFAAIRRELLAHKVLFLRDQDISKAEHVAFAERFGALEDHPALGSDPDHPGLVRIYKDLNSPPDHFENAWHCDATWREAPPMGCVLRCRRRPGGRRRHDLGQHGQGLCRPARHGEADDRRRSMPAIRSRRRFGARMPIEQRHALKARFPDAEHPVVRTHPETGEKVLFVNGFTTHFTNFHTPENVRYGQDYRARRRRTCSPI